MKPKNPREKPGNSTRLLSQRLARKYPYSLKRQGRTNTDVRNFATGKNAMSRHIWRRATNNIAKENQKKLREIMAIAIENAERTEGNWRDFQLNERQKELFKGITKFELEQIYQDIRQEIERMGVNKIGVTEIGIANHTLVHGFDFAETFIKFLRTAHK